MTPDEMHKQYFSKDYKRGFSDGQEHSKPSPQTLKLIEQIKRDNNKMENQMITMQNDISNIKEKLEKMPTRDEMIIANKTIIEEIFCKIDKRFEDHDIKADKKYAVKQVEKLVYAGIGMILAAFMGGLIYAGFYFANQL